MTSSNFKKRKVFCASQPVKLVIVHYHLRPGGIRRVIELATPHLLQASGSVKTVELACGEAADKKWTRTFAQLVSPAKLYITVAPAFGYFSEQKIAPRQIRSRIAAALENIFAGANQTNCLVWAHNLGIGRNLLLTRELARVCAARGIMLISHHHDWWFDNRWLRWPEIRRSGFRTFAAVAKTIFPALPNIRHAGINREEAGILKRYSAAPSAWLPNPVPRSLPPARNSTQTARTWLDHALGGRNAPVWIFPCRFLRRKNVAEALLLTRWLRPEAWLVTTGGASSADELACFDKLNAAAKANNWRLRLGVLHGDEQRKPNVPELLAASEAVLVTSIQEGFGLPYLEAAAANRPLIARKLPNVAPDLQKFGFRLPQTYDEILVPTGLFDWNAEHDRQQKQFAHWRSILPPAARKWLDVPEVFKSHGRPGAVPFSRLTLRAQLEVVAQPVAISWQQSLPLNPFLQVWKHRADAGKLRVTTWPRSAGHWLGGRNYARQFAELARPDHPRKRKPGAFALQNALLGEKLCAANLYPLLWTTTP